MGTLPAKERTAMQQQQPIAETDPTARGTAPPAGRPSGEEPVVPQPASRTDASTGPLLPESHSAPGDPNYHEGRRVIGTSLWMFLPAVILLIVGIAVILYLVR
jgi:hypothetical protein